MSSPFCFSISLAKSGNKRKSYSEIVRQLLLKGLEKETKDKADGEGVILMPKLRTSPKAARDRAIRGQIASKSFERYGVPLTGKSFGRMFGVKPRTATNRMQDLGTILLEELWTYVDTSALSDAEILKWFGR